MNPTVSRPSVLFLCTGNSARSQLAEALLRHLAPGRYRVLSAGTRPAARVHPLALAVLEEQGIPTVGLVPKSLAEVRRTGDIVHLITVCAAAARECPTGWAGVRTHEHWPLEDPAAAVGDGEQRLNVFRAARDEIERRILRWLERGEACG
ncbi:MAG: arsenate reductase ArsC [Acidobacteriota bacterium]|nr:arsenate reductase ArsC [Acidobacteriota bacterium]MDQ7086475.1 arsenate reductase ArsC [Acidobacteriota bacterium]